MKTETKHTPGPWTVLDTGHGYDIVGDKHQQVLIADCYPDSVEDYETPLDDELKANARLIAAAPEMLEALRSIQELLDCGNREESHLDDCLGYARAAIAKATGK